MTRHPHTLLLAVASLLASGLLLVPAAPAGAGLPLEDYAPYQGASRCTPRAKPGTLVLARWIRSRHGSSTSVSRACRRDRDVTSEHQEGRAIDWRADATTRKGRKAARALLKDLFADDARGNPAALARRAGVMYVIWDDHMYAAWRGFEPEPYLSSSCQRRKRCSKTLRHRDHVHVSLTRKAARGQTSFYLRRSSTDG